jgi:hypothetical protein
MEFYRFLQRYDFFSHGYPGKYLWIFAYGRSSIRNSTFQLSTLDLTAPESGIYFNGINIWHKIRMNFNALSMQDTNLEA